MWIWKGNGRALPAGMSKIQCTKEKPTKGGGNGEDENRKVAREPKVYQIHNAICSHGEKREITLGELERIGDISVMTTTR